jgi:hypothetical protein
LGTKKWPSVGGGGSLLLYRDTPLVPGPVTNRDKRPGLKGDFEREPQKRKFPSLVPGGVTTPLLSRVITPPGTKGIFCAGL